jgi:hypothetical protein
MVTQTLSRSGVMYSPMKAARQENSMRSNFTGTAHEVKKFTKLPKLRPHCNLRCNTDVVGQSASGRSGPVRLDSRMSAFLEGGGQACSP